MTPTPNPAKQALQRGEVVVGTWASRISTPAFSTILARAGFQFVYFDMEHSSTGTETIEALIAAARAAGTAPIVRPPGIDLPMIGRLLDIGAMGVLVPDVSTAEDVEHIVQAAKYYPEGHRAMAPIGPQTDWYPVTPKDYEGLNKETLIAVLLESDAAFQNLDEILSVPGLDVVSVGRFDLSASLGIPGQVNHPRVVERVDMLIDAASRHGVASGIHVRDVAAGLELIQKGVRWIPVSSVVDIVLEGGRRIVENIRQGRSST